LKLYMYPRVGLISAVLTLYQPLPVYPNKQTFFGAVGMSQRCQYRKSVALLNHFVGACEQRRRNIESKRFCGRDINNEIELGRSHHRQVSRTIALYYANGVHSGLVVIVL
jgi:tRNA threonylcarbamoyladenosine modification (KEOPS) complex Cgi121 subunit